MTFIIHFKDGHRETYSNHYDENDDPERDAAWMMFIGHSQMLII